MQLYMYFKPLRLWFFFFVCFFCFRVLVYSYLFYSLILFFFCYSMDVFCYGNNFYMQFFFLFFLYLLSFQILVRRFFSLQIFIPFFFFFFWCIHWNANHLWEYFKSSRFFSDHSFSFVFSCYVFLIFFFHRTEAIFIYMFSFFYTFEASEGYFIIRKR